MKPLFEIPEEPHPAQYSLGGYNLPGLPPVTFANVGDEAHLYDVMSRLPADAYDLVVYHCRGPLSPHEVPMIYGLRRVAIGKIVLFHHTKKSVAKKYRQAMRLTGFRRLRTVGLYPVSVWNSAEEEGFDLQRCKTTVSLEKQSRAFYARLFTKDTSSVLEVFPKEGAAPVSEASLSKGIPTTLFLLGDGSQNKVLLQRISRRDDI